MLPPFVYESPEFPVVFARRSTALHFRLAASFPKSLLRFAGLRLKPAYGV
jgi:hypothetical protein